MPTELLWFRGNIMGSYWVDVIYYPCSWGLFHRQYYNMYLETLDKSLGYERLRDILPDIKNYLLYLLYHWIHAPM